ncbi:hypothetical protein JK628_02745 [Shewanella sp. KX20019]|uniref:hypothetical protein n=1 Tax=Shewanella sp. KX20019 TaxID=2803864 RepID=UPI001928279A|nr:hypothetical protein [Shewanella sp. KX20019]QQX80807.1 hypothetical protein JK628_02745 [Shewanella sp. KX20019]
MCNLCDFISESAKDIEKKLPEFEKLFIENVVSENETVNCFSKDELDFTIRLEFARKMIASTFLGLLSTGLEQDIFLQAIYDALDHSDDPKESLLFELSSRFNKRLFESETGLDPETIIKKMIAYEEITGKEFSGAVVVKPKSQRDDKGTVH